MRFIGVCGRKSSGKSEIVQFIHEYFINVKTLSFSEPIKQMCKFGYGLTDEQLGSGKDVEDQRWERTPRDMMISTSRTMTFMDDDHWVNLMTNTISDIETSGLTHICISDIRFHNEADFIKTIGGCIINIRTVKDENPEFVLDDDITERYPDEIEADYYIVNNGNLENLKFQCDLILRKIHELV